MDTFYRIDGVAEYDDELSVVVLPSFFPEQIQPDYGCIHLSAARMGGLCGVSA